MQLQADQIRSTFLKYFEQNEHHVTDPAPVVPKDDPTLLFTNSGMAPLKPLVEGLQEPVHRRLVNFQPCIRTNDIDDVGDRHHLTMFEMLGSWSIGDYDKEVAIPLAWRLLTDQLGFSTDRLYVTIYNGDAAFNIPQDDASYKIWRSLGVASDHIVALGQEDNFWGPTNVTGPCGPCTEVFFDTGDAFGTAYVPGGEFDTKHRYLEIWNAGVFMEFSMTASGALVDLPVKSVDTGCGLERMEMVQNGFESVYDTSLLRPLVDMAKAGLTGETLTERDYRVVADHLRATTFILAAGVQPSNEGRGYVPRRLLRRCLAVVHRSENPHFDLAPIVRRVVELMAPHYPHLLDEQDNVLAVVASERQKFERALQRGRALISKEIAKSSDAVVSGAFLFAAVTTHGVPYDILKEELQRHDVQADEGEYERLTQAHRTLSKERSRLPTGVNHKAAA